MSHKENKEKTSDVSTGVSTTIRNHISGEPAKDSDQEQAFEEQLEQGGELRAR